MPETDEYLPGLRPPLEAQLIDLADEAAYNTADLDDGFAAGLIRIDDARNAVPRLNQLFEEAEGQFPGASERVRFSEVLRSLIDWLVSGLINGTLEAATAAGLSTVDDVRAHPRRVACFTPEAQATARELKQLLFHSVYLSDALVRERKLNGAMMAECSSSSWTIPRRCRRSTGPPKREGMRPRGVRLHRRDDRWVLPPLLPADELSGNLDHLGPVTGDVLAEEAHGWVPGAVAAAPASSASRVGRGAGSRRGRRALRPRWAVILSTLMMRSIRSMAAAVAALLPSGRQAVWTGNGTWRASPLRGPCCRL